MTVKDKYIEMESRINQSRLLDSFSSFENEGLMNTSKALIKENASLQKKVEELKQKKSDLTELLITRRIERTALEKKLEELERSLKTFLQYYESDFIKVTAEDGRTLASLIVKMEQALNQ